jgi:serine phosphatase RsbU (regulator of sigma subunit)
MTASKSSSEDAPDFQTTPHPGGIRSLLAAPGRLVALAVLLLLVAARVFDPELLQSITWRSFDVQQQIAPRRYTPSGVSTVVVDEDSLARYGQWPWPRTLVARLVRQIAASKPRVLALDILFPEPDRLSPGRLAEAVPDLPASLARDLAALPTNEVALAEAFRLVPTVLAVGARRHGSGSAAQGPRRITPVRTSGPDPRPFLEEEFEFDELVRSLPELTAAERGRGAIVPAPRGGIMRCVPLFVHSQNTLAPTLALEILRVAFGVNSVVIVTADDGIHGATLGDVFVPTDRRGCAHPRFTEPPLSRYISAADLLDGKLPESRLRDELVLLGVIGQGLLDLWQTPLGLMYGVEVQAQLVESILTTDLLRRPAGLGEMEVGLVLAAGMATIFALPYRRPWIAWAGFLGVVALMFGIAATGFHLFNLMLDGVYPVMTSGIIFGVMLAASLRAAEAERRSLAATLEREREIQARRDGELNAARTIQMGLLPQPFLGAPERRDVEVFALIEPARELGGDLYDFFLADPQRLAFAIADLSGKGVPAALFMAMTKEILRDATARHGSALDRVLAEANAKISAAGGDMRDGGVSMTYVTVFAGVLDLSSGSLVYGNAGHDAPYVLRRGADPLRLTTPGGPPLGTVDDFPYPLEHRRLAPGDVLFLHTDGVTESEDINHDLYSTARLAQLLASAPLGSARAVVEFVREDVRRFAAGAEQADDITLLAIRWVGPEAAAD